ncbi:nitrate reductase cytochrome c-type subunit [Thalassotalea sp. PP2-459]|uniref:nitrate reductase cytochrome c-type subunit n=1 Tax=Thalassotalea sp. PP2-459 TaxID=1742724 RepID=UPI000944941A|nr:nitrate reductase cytochrome c-type subunit [Thalassotalea sp. PP2-459]OKY27722.1 periplasmic nitrate reductase electron transfer subunit [Thalassotalea sp. PP2-459]
MNKTMQYTYSTLLSLLLITTTVAAFDDVATLRKGKALDQQSPSSPIANVMNNDIKQARNYPMQPPVIPHKTRNYEVNLNTNKCMSCHSRKRTEESQAPMVSVTHYMDRDGNFLAEISPRRYFCNQCHATQTDAKTLVDNTFIDMHSLMKTKQKSEN